MHTPGVDFLSSSAASIPIMPSPRTSTREPRATVTRVAMRIAQLSGSKRVALTSSIASGILMIGLKPCAQFARQYCAKPPG